MKTRFRLDEYVFSDTGDFIGIFDTIEQSEKQFSDSLSTERTTQCSEQNKPHHQVTEFAGEWEEGQIIRTFYYYK